jgi:hypothetical protein
MTTLSVVIPAYNEEESIQAVLRRVLAVRPCLAEAKGALFGKEEGVRGGFEMWLVSGVDTGVI